MRHLDCTQADLIPGLSSNIRLVLLPHPSLPSPSTHTLLLISLFILLTSRYDILFCASHSLPLQVTFGLVTEFKEMQKWDAMLLSLEVLDEEPKQYPVTHVGTFISTYGVPGERSRDTTGGTVIDRDAVVLN